MRQGVHVVVAGGGFSAVLTPFSGLRAFPRETQFSEPSMVKSSLPSRAPLPICSATCGHAHLDSL